MATTITGKLNKPANQFQAGDGSGFGIRLGVRYYDRETKQQEWTNYECVVFAKAGPQADFYAQSLVEGAIVEVSGREEKIKVFEGQNGQSLSIELLDAKLGYIGTVGAPQQNQNQGYGGQQAAPQQGFNNQAPQQQGFGGQQQQAPQQQAQQAQQPQQQPQGGFDQNIPF